VLFGKGLGQVSNLYANGEYIGKVTNVVFDVETTDKEKVVIFGTPTGKHSSFYDKYVASKEYENSFNACREVPIQLIPDLPDTLEGRVRHWIKYPTDHVPVSRRWMCKDGDLGQDMKDYAQSSTLPNMICSTLISRITAKGGLNITPKHYRTAILSRINYGLYLMARFISGHEAGCILPDSYRLGLEYIKECDTMFAEENRTFASTISLCITQNSDAY
jgi:sporulation protein YlmC with PRC-barrel domain